MMLINNMKHILALDPYNSRQRQYQIEVDREVYTTIDVLSDSAADSPLGCGTRVWKVKESSGRIRILKDVWLKLNGQEEHRIHRAILADTKALNVEENDDFDEQLSQRVLRPMAYCRVRIDNEEDSTNTVMGGGYDLDNTMIMVEPVTFQQLSSVEPRGRMINILLHNQAPLLVRIRTLQLNTLVHAERPST
ncbi:Ras GTPase-activating-like protein IQGAP1 [Mus musculus] [Lentinula edodes]|uniref:Ras GTPase-activating-like protein IQGAP1 [Mus musculus] n=1 Tax=Lentinula edodes TaxID=5353 RepID=A0A1Q3ELM2_LENED|nr:Ras GTPase-activating-like protein IQGAP1 [Mus musculus] [Lentinula edodes]